jgi:hypothetical protein
MRVACARDEDLRRADAPEETADVTSEFVLVIAQPTVWKVEFEAIRWRDAQDVECPVPFIVADLGNFLRGGPRSRRVPASAPICGHGHRDRDPAVPLLRHEEATSDGLVVFMR